jgi:hypothetical protein
LYKAITDDKTVQIQAEKNAPGVLFGKSDLGEKGPEKGTPGLHTIAFDQANKLDSVGNAGGLSSAQLVAHETIEAYSELEGNSFEAAHEYANSLAGGLGAVALALEISDKNGNITGVTIFFPVIGSSVHEMVSIKFNTPIPKEAINNTSRVKEYKVTGVEVVK